MFRLHLDTCAEAIHHFLEKTLDDDPLILPLITLLPILDNLDTYVDKYFSIRQAIGNIHRELSSLLIYSDKIYQSIGKAETICRQVVKNLKEKFQDADRTANLIAILESAENYINSELNELGSEMRVYFNAKKTSQTQSPQVKNNPIQFEKMPVESMQSRPRMSSNLFKESKPSSESKSTSLPNAPALMRTAKLE